MGLGKRFLEMMAVECLDLAQRRAEADARRPVAPALDVVASRQGLAEERRLAGPNREPQPQHYGIIRECLAYTS